GTRPPQCGPGKAGRIHTWVTLAAGAQVVVARFGCSIGPSQGPLSGVKRTDRARVTKARRRRPVSALVCSRPPSRTILRDRTAVKCVMDLRGRPEGADSPMIETPTEGVRLTLQFSVDGTLLSVPRVCPTR